jgi:hypothetical protein
VHRVATKKWVVLHNFHTLRRIGFVFLGCVARSGFAFFFRFGAFKRNDKAGGFLSHDGILKEWTNRNCQDVMCGAKDVKICQKKAYKTPLASISFTIAV